MQTGIGNLPFDVSGKITAFQHNLFCRRIKEIFFAGKQRCFCFFRSLAGHLTDVRQINAVPVGIGNQSCRHNIIGVIRFFPGVLRPFEQNIARFIDIFSGLDSGFIDNRNLFAIFNGGNLVIFRIFRTKAVHSTV